MKPTFQDLAEERGGATVYCCTTAPEGWTGFAAERLSCPDCPEIAEPQSQSHEKPKKNAINLVWSAAEPASIVHIQ